MIKSFLNLQRLELLLKMAQIYITGVRNLKNYNFKRVSVSGAVSYLWDLSSRYPEDINIKGLSTKDETYKDGFAKFTRSFFFQRCKLV